ncbi:MAG: hypothetical protein AB7F23_09520 [Phycisphaerae bacterium]
MKVLKKIAIFLLTLVICLGVYFGIRALKRPVVIPVGKGYTIVEITPEEAQSAAGSDEAGPEDVSEQALYPVIAEGSGSFGETQIGETMRSEFKLLDENGNVASYFGFDKLLHQDGMRWKIEKPHITMYNEKYSYKVVAAEGTITVEMVAGKPRPVQAELYGDVVVDFNAATDFPVKVSLDSLIYRIDQNRLTGTGKVRFDSDTVEIEGNGLELTYENISNRITYLKIDSVDRISVFEYAAADEKGASNSESVLNTPDEQADLYELTLNDNVRLTAEENQIFASIVRVSNIPWKRSDAGKQAPDDKTAGGRTAEPAVDDAGYLANADKPQQQPAPKREKRLVLTASCRRELEFKPVKRVLDGGKTLIEFAGAPVVVQSGETEAKCSIIRYNVPGKLLTMLPSEKSAVELSISSGSTVLTAQNSLEYNEAEKTARVSGPGKITTVGSSGAVDAIVSFEGRIFAEFTEERKLTSVDLWDNVKMITTGDSPAEILSGRASLTLTESGTPDEVKLSDNVSVITPDGKITSDFLDVNFAEVDGKSAPALARAHGNARLSPAAGNGTDYSSLFSANELTYDFAKSESVASGNILLDLSMPAASGSEEKIPLQITCTDDVVFRADSSSVVFSGDVYGRSNVVKPFHTEQTDFSSDKLVVEMNGTAGGTLKALRLTGDKVVFNNKSYTKSKVISASRLTCAGLLYDAESDFVYATGPGKIEVNNRNVVAAPATNNSLDLSARCYALVDNFTELQLDRKNGSVYARGGEKPLRIGYLPVAEDGSTASEKLLDAAELNLVYATSPDGKTYVSELKADGGVSYFESEKFTLMGDNLSYSSADGNLHIKGTDKTPCVVNNNVVSEIFYNLITGDFKTTLSGISTQ